MERAHRCDAASRQPCSGELGAGSAQRSRTTFADGDPGDGEPGCCSTRTACEARFGVDHSEKAAGRQRPNCLDCVHLFYAAVIMWAKYLVRDDSWSAKVRDWDSKKQLLQMAEWHEKSRNDGTSTSGRTARVCANGQIPH
jgi:hypothetical protein